MKIERKCDFCQQTYFADKRNLNRGWGLCCTKSCAAHKREKGKRKTKSSVKRENFKYKKYGFPDYETYERDFDMEDGCWDAHGNVTLEICKICRLRCDYCECGEGEFNW